MNFNLKRNSVWAATEVVVTGASIFLLYRYVVVYLGVRALGVWSLVLATTSLARLGDLGASAGLSRFVAIAIARNDSSLARAYMETAILTNLLLFVILGTILYYPFWWGIKFVVPANALMIARSLLPYTIASFVLLNLNAVTLSALVGLQRSDLKSLVVIVAMFVQMLVAVIVVPRYGLIGLAWGQVGQYGVSTAAAWIIFLRRTKSGLQRGALLHFDSAAFRDLIGFGLKLQALNLINFAFEPATKFVMSSVCGLEALGIYEMTYRMLTQVRQIVVAPTQALVPAFAHLWEANPSGIAGLYERAVVNSIIFGVPLLVLVGLLSPVIGWLWLGRNDPLFVAFSIVGSLGWIASLIGAPSYLLGVSRGLVRWNIIGLAFTSFCGPLVALIVGRVTGPIGVVSAAMLGLGGGSLFAMVMNCAMFDISPLPGRRAFAQAVIDNKQWSFQLLKRLFRFHDN